MNSMINKNKVSVRKVFLFFFVLLYHLSFGQNSPKNQIGLFVNPNFSVINDNLADFDHEFTVSYGLKLSRKFGRIQPHLSCLIMNQNTSFIYSYSTITEPNNQSETGRAYFDFRTLALAIGLDIHLLEREKVVFFVSSSIYYGHFSKKEERIKDEIRKLMYFPDYHIGFMVGMGVGFNISPEFQLTVNPIFSYQLNHVFKERKVPLMSYGLNTGISYLF